MTTRDDVAAPASTSPWLALVSTSVPPTMWVHLNHGNSALLGLLSLLAFWNCYRSAAQRLRKLGRSYFDHFKELKIRGDMAEHARKHLTKHSGMALMQCFGSTTWDPRLLLFMRK